MGTQKNRLSETILLSTHNIEFALIIREKLWGKELNTPPYLDLCVTVTVTHIMDNILLYFHRLVGSDSSTDDSHTQSEKIRIYYLSAFSRSPSIYFPCLEDIYAR